LKGVFALLIRFYLPIALHSRPVVIVQEHNAECLAKVPALDGYAIVSRVCLIPDGGHE